MLHPQTLCLRLDKTAISTLLQHPLVSHKPTQRRIHQTCYETPDFRLAALGFSIEETRILRKTEITVRDTNQLWQAPTSAGSFDFSTLIDVPDVAESLQNIASDLVPIYSMDIRQRVWTVHIRSAIVEVALKEGTLNCGVTEPKTSSGVCELELTLIKGQEAALYGLGRLLSRQVKLHPIPTLLRQRALECYRGDIPKPVKACRIKLDPKNTPQAVFKQVARECLDQLLANETGIFLPSNVEFIHQARVALRRLRTALRLFSDELPPEFSNKWSKEWREVGEQLGNARNWDVFCSEMLPAIQADLGDHPEAIKLAEFAQTQRALAHSETRQWLEGRKYSLILIAFSEAILTLDDQSKDRIETFATKSLRKRYKKFCRGAQIAHTLSPEARHEVRIDLKKLRYALDFFDSLYPQKQLQGFLKGLAETQELLGHMNDLVTGELLLATRPDTPFDLPVAWARGRMSAYLEMLPSALKPVLDAKTPW